MEKVAIFITDCGNGHRSCADSLIFFIKEKYPDTQISLINPYKEIFKSKNENFYNKFYHMRLFLLLCSTLMWLVKFIFKLRKSTLEKGLTTYLKNSKPDIVISMMPYINEYLSHACKNAEINNFSVILTDWSDEKKIWLSKDIPKVFCNTSHAVNLAKQLGIKDVVQVSGMILKPQFYDDSINKTSIDLELDKNKKTVLVMYGLGEVNKTIDIFKKFEKYSDKLQFIVLCGNNKILFEQLKQFEHKFKIFAVPFVKNPAPYFKVANIFIGKAGPGSLSEAMFFKLPIITELNILTLSQERFNAKLVKQNNWGIITSNFKKLPDIFKQLELKEDNLKQYTIEDNRGVFEIIDNIFQ